MARGMKYQNYDLRVGGTEIKSIKQSKWQNMKIQSENMHDVIKVHSKNSSMKSLLEFRTGAKKYAYHCQDK